jgi:hypothetical protein
VIRIASAYRGPDRKPRVGGGRSMHVLGPAYDPSAEARKAREYIELLRAIAATGLSARFAALAVRLDATGEVAHAEIASACRTHAAFVARNTGLSVQSLRSWEAALAMLTEVVESIERRSERGRATPRGNPRRRAHVVSASARRGRRADGLENGLSFWPELEGGSRLVPTVR